MAGIAEVLVNLGYSVSGSDLKTGKLTGHLEELGVEVSVGHSAENVPSQTTAMIYSSAITPENPELQLASENKIPLIPRAEMLAELMRMKYGIAVAGSHGKTTTTSLLAKLLAESEIDPTVIIGGRVLTQRTGAQLGAGPYLVAEADESDGSFCLLRPAIAVVTNIDREHLCHYGSFGALEGAFLQFMSSVPFYGLVVACYDDPVVVKLAAQLERRVVSYGFSPHCEVRAEDVVVGEDGSSFNLCLAEENVGRLSIPMPGQHLVSNALAAIAVSRELGLEVEQMRRGLEDFPGVARRSELIGEFSGVRVIDDYAHHPREIAATISGIKQAWLSGASSGRLIVLFEPHRYSRTQELFADFVNCFAQADEVVVGDIYPAGEEVIEGVSGERLSHSLQGTKSFYVANLMDSIPGLLKSLAPGDVVATFGAGAVGEVAHKIAQELGRKNSAG